ncbi:hypothetical protein CHH64_09290 [Terribacillus saccharophilus]|uniref:Uncharacterized protein n=1 Tax=Terribacillus saccharophilus TaxID=361277 RepID=A0A268AB45_9BACI|nr:hypothetical protein CHH64_09290 [Terribacillus saccharophilus]
MLLYHTIHKIYEDFENVYRYRMNGINGALIETDRKLEKGQVIIIKDINDYAIVVDCNWGRKMVQCVSPIRLHKI